MSALRLFHGTGRQTHDVRDVELERFYLQTRGELRLLLGIAVGITRDEQSDLAHWQTVPRPQMRASARPDAWHPVHRHDVAVCELAIGGSSSTVAVATRQTREPVAPSRACSKSRKGEALLGG